MEKVVNEVFDKSKEMLVSVDGKTWKKEKVIGIFNNWAMVEIHVVENDIDTVRYLNYSYYKYLDVLLEEIAKFSKEDLEIILEK